MSIPKPDGRQRPLGIAALEDKIVQGAVVEVLNAIWEADFLGFRYGFRPGRSQHDALDALAVGITEQNVNFILDADIAGFFDTVNHDWLIKFVEHRIADRRILRLIRKWLRAGVMEDGVVRPGTVGTPQGAVVSPVLANIYLHYVFDLWAHHWRKRQARGAVILVRYADDIIAGFEHRAEAERFLAELRERMRGFGLTLHPEKTRLIEFGRQAAANRNSRGLGKPETFDFLGFTHICGRSRRGAFQLRTEDPRRSHARHPAGGQGGAAPPHARADRCTGALAGTGGAGLQCLSRHPDQLRRPGGLPLSHHGPVAGRASAARPEGPDELAADDRAARSLAPQTPHHPFLAQSTLRRPPPEVGARCGNAARRDLCGGCVPTRIPTAIKSRGDCSQQHDNLGWCLSPTSKLTVHNTGRCWRQNGKSRWRRNGSKILTASVHLPGRGKRAAFSR